MTNSILIGALLIVALAAACQPTEATRGAESPEGLVTAYLSAFESRDSAAMLALVNARVEANAGVEEAIGANGGRSVSDPSITYQEEFGGAYIVATVDGTASDGSAFQVAIPIGRDEGRFYLALSQASPTGSESTTSSPTPTP